MAIPIALALGLLWVWWAAHRSRELFVLSVRGGRVLLVRGRIPVGLSHALSDVLSRARVKRATLRALRSEGYARVEASGLDANTLQRSRNVVGTVAFERILNAPPQRRQNLGQRLGIEWLSWLLTPQGRSAGAGKESVRLLSHRSDAPDPH